MTQEEKQLLLKDLCARLPYSVWGLHRGEDLPLYVIDNSGAYMVLGYNAWFNLDTVDFKPYLRPMSSMTDDEANQYYKIRTGEDRKKPIGKLDAELFDFYHKNHIDYRGLIPMGLALEAPEGMYKNN